MLNPFINAHTLQKVLHWGKMPPCVGQDAQDDALHIL